MSKFEKIREYMKSHKKITAAGVVLLIAAIVGVTVVSSAKQKTERMMAAMNQMQTAKAERRTLVSSVSATGTLTSVNSKQVTVNLSGVEVKSVSVELGDTVEEGQVLCEFDAEDIEENLADARTALEVSNQKTQMDLTAAERNLENAKEDYDTELKRGNTDLGVAYNDYVEALEDVEEAEDQWEEAKATVIEKKGEYELRLSRLEEKKAQAEAAGSSGAFEQEFNNRKNTLKTYVEDSTHQVTTNGGMDKVYLTNSDLGNITVGDSGSGCDFCAPDDEVRNTIKGYIEGMVQIQARYSASAAVEAEYAALQKEVSEWQTKYDAAKQNESSAEKTYEQQLSVSESQLQAYQKQQRNLDDTTKTVENSVITKTESLTTAQLNALTSGTSEEAKVEEYEQQLEDCTVKAPISGVISAVNIEEGDTYNGSAIVTIDDVSSFEVTAEIDEYDIAKIEKGQKVVIKTNATGDEELEGTVKLVSPKASTGTNDVTYTVTISVDTPNDMLRMDMTAKLSIILESKENVLTVPYEAVQEDEEGKFYVEVLEDKKESQKGTQTDAPDSFRNAEEKTQDKQMPTEEGTKRIYVEKGIESDYYIEVVSDKITEGVEVAVPKSDSEEGGIQMMMMRQGPMGGF